MEAWTDLEGLDIRETDTLTSKYRFLMRYVSHCLDAGFLFGTELFIGSCTEYLVLWNPYSYHCSSKSGHSLRLLGVCAQYIVFRTCSSISSLESAHGL